ncbi:unnamed protein product [Ectocarpus sp. 12 AP-2014]
MIRTVGSGSIVSTRSMQRLSDTHECVGVAWCGARKIKRRDIYRKRYIENMETEGEPQISPLQQCNAKRTVRGLETTVCGHLRKGNGPFLFCCHLHCSEVVGSIPKSPSYKGLSYRSKKHGIFHGTVFS